MRPQTPAPDRSSSADSPQAPAIAAQSELPLLSFLPAQEFELAREGQVASIASLRALGLERRDGDVVKFAAGCGR